ncbi:MAG: dihydroorotase [Gammaproteobacteria bacterium]
MTDSITLIRPDDWHLHLRDGAAMRSVVAHTADRFARAIVMPNLSPPVTTASAAHEYRQRILAALPNDTSFNPLMALYLTPSTSAKDIADAAEAEHVIGVKWYPAGATTNSNLGVHNIADCAQTLEAMAEHNVPLLVHGEVTDSDVDTFDREAVFVDTILEPLLRRLPNLKVVLEHITTSQGADFVSDSGPNVAGTLTPQHLLLNRTALFQGGLRPHNYCLPILKRESHRLRLLEAATSGSPSFFLGTDSAPHPQTAKESDCGCAGIYSAHAGIELYAEAFDQADSLDQLERFASLNGPAFYGLPVNTDTITLKRDAWPVPDSYPIGDERLIPFRAGHNMLWSMV